MSISVFFTQTNPLERGDMLFQPIGSYEGFADEIVSVDGSKEPRLHEGLHEIEDKSLLQVNHEWPREFDWTLIGQQFQRGYEAARCEWVIHADLDFIFHEQDYGRIRQALKDYPSAPGVSFYKWQFLQPRRYNLKSRLIVAVNKKAYGDRIRFDSGGDLCQPSLDGRELSLSEMPQAGVPIYNYEHILKTKEQVMDDVGRMDRAYHKHFGSYQYGSDGTDESAFEGWVKMMQGRYSKPHADLPLEKHPKIMQDTIRLLQPEQFGYNGWQLLEG